MTDRPLTDGAHGLKVGIIGNGSELRQHTQSWTARGPRKVICPSLGDGVDSAGRGELVRFLETVDAVDICAPLYGRAALALAAAGAGKAAMCVSPAFRSVDEAVKVAKAFQETGVALFIVPRLSLRPGYVAARQTVIDTGIGTPAVLRLSRSWPARSGEKEEDRLFFDFMLEDIGYARSIGGEVESVFARATGTTSEHAISVLKHASGMISHLECAWLGPLQSESEALELSGTDGLIVLNSQASAALKVFPAQGSSQWFPHEPQALVDLAVGRFVEVLNGRMNAARTVSDAVMECRLAEAAARSALSGRPIATSFDKAAGR